MNAKTPEISVVVPVYKVEKFIKKCVESILAQTFRDFELSLVDDGSPDASGTLCDEFSARDSRVRVFHKNNGGVSSARNFGIEKSSGKWICFVDSDDEIDENYLENLFSNSNGAELVVSGFVRFYSTSLGIVKNFHTYKNCLCSRFEALREHNLHKFGFPFSKLFLKEIIAKNELKFHEKVKLGEDQIFLLDYLQFVKKVRFLDFHNYLYFERGESLTKKSSPFEIEIIRFEKIREALDKLDLKPFAKGERENISNAFFRAVSCLYRPHSKVFSKKARLETLGNAHKMLRGEFSPADLSLLERLFFAKRFVLFDFLYNFSFALLYSPLGKIYRFFQLLYLVKIKPRIQH